MSGASYSLSIFMIPSFSLCINCSKEKPQTQENLSDGLFGCNSDFGIGSVP
jgi:hypothetical protein